MQGVRAEVATDRGKTHTKGIEWPNFILGWDYNAAERDSSGRLGPKTMYFAEIHLKIPFKHGISTLNKIQKAADAHDIDGVKTLLIAELPEDPQDPRYKAKKAVIDHLSFWS
jgi:hypothetical protein